MAIENTNLHETVGDDAGKMAHDMPRMHFTVGGRTLPFTITEMKEISNYYWEHFGKHSMEHFFERYRRKAAENIRAALRMAEAPADEHDVKWALAMALRHGEPELIAEVLFEAMEWETAYAALKNIEGK